jgi:hypothetical protein
MRWLVAASLLLASAMPVPGAGQAGALLATWKDGEIRESFDASARESSIHVAVMPAGPYGSLTLVVSARWPGRARLKPLDEFEVRADVGLRINPNFIRQPTLVFTLDPETDRARVLDLSERLQIPPAGAGAAIDTGRVTISLVELIQLLRARVVTAEVFALPLSFTSAQLEALRKFGDRVLAPPPEPMARTSFPRAAMP